MSHFQTHRSKKFNIYFKGKNIIRWVFEILQKIWSFKWTLHLFSNIMSSNVPHYHICFSCELHIGRALWSSMRRANMFCTNVLCTQLTFNLLWCLHVTKCTLIPKCEWQMWRMWSMMCCLHVTKCILITKCVWQMWRMWSMMCFTVSSYIHICVSSSTLHSSHSHMCYSACVKV